MKDLRKLTLEESNKVECALIMLESAFKEEIEIAERLSECTELDEKTRATFRSNAEWWREVYNLLYTEVAI